MGGSGPQAAGSKDWLALGSVLGRGGVGSDLGWLAGSEARAPWPGLAWLARKK